ncbi:MAG: hypothetical protein NTX61_12280 [Bacteroidetes bacterium]|nr:hypothetical protein [Bacteroidota bacterium]
MFKLIKFVVMLFLPVLFFLSCTNNVTSQGGSSTSGNTNTSVSSPACIIYKTRSDYSKNVPVMLSDDKKRITSYPGIRDIYTHGVLAYPDILANGFLFDNRGIGPNVAFLKYTYTDYQRLEKMPSAEELWKQILDNDPIIEMYQCGTRSQYSDPVTELNKIITDGKLKDCKKLK